MTKQAARQKRMQQETEAIASLKAAMRAVAARSGHKAQLGGVSVDPITDSLHAPVYFLDAEGDQKFSAIAFIYLNLDLIRVVDWDAVGNTKPRRFDTKASYWGLTEPGSLYLKTGGRVYASGSVAAFLNDATFTIAR